MTLLIMVTLPSVASGSVPPANYQVAETIIHVSPQDTPCSFNDVQFTSLLIRDMQGNVITETTANSQVMFEASVTHCNNLNDEPLLIAFEVRSSDENESTGYFATQTRNANSDEQIVIGSSWLTPNAPGEYKVIAFYMPCFSCRFFLNEVLQYNFTLLPA
jgi:hypothetical protein